MERRPQGLTMVGVAMIVAGILSSCCNASGLFSVVANLGLTHALTDSGVQTGDTAALVHMQRDVAIFTGIPAMLGIVAALFVIAGGGLALTMRPPGRTVAVASIATMLFVALIDLGMTAAGTLRMMSTVTSLAAGDPGGMPVGGTQIATLMGIGTGAAYLVIKLAIYVPCLVYLLRPETKVLFGTPTAPSVRGD